MGLGYQVPVKNREKDLIVLRLGPQCAACAEFPGHRALAAAGVLLRTSPMKSRSALLKCYPCLKRRRSAFPGAQLRGVSAGNGEAPGRQGLFSPSCGPRLEPGGVAGVRSLGRLWHPRGGEGAAPRAAAGCCESLPLAAWICPSESPRGSKAVLRFCRQDL